MAQGADSLETLYLEWREILAADPDMSLDDMRRLLDHWGDVTEEPRGVDYCEVDARHVPAMWLLPKDHDRRLVLLCLHGGGLVVGSMYSHRKLYGHFAKRAHARALVVDYGRAPENLHPGPVNDAVKAYRWLLEDEGIAASDIVFVGDSAGGGLAITAMLLARELGLPLPAGAIGLSPMFDSEAQGESFETNAEFDKIVSRDMARQMMAMVAGPGADLRDPLLRPLDQAWLGGLPPILLQASDSETLFDDSRLFERLAKAGGVDVTLEVYPRMQHVFHFMAGNHPEADRAIDRACDWIRNLRR